MTSNAASFVGNVPHYYDGGLGPVIFVDYAADMARRVGARPVSRVLETAAGTGIVSRQLRDVLPANAQLTATDLNPPMVEVARTKFQSSERWTCARPMPWPCRSQTAPSMRSYASLA